MLCRFKGCGKFAADSWRIFCRGHRDLRSVDDVSLCRFLRWLVKEELPGDGRKKLARQQQGGRKRKAERPTEAGTLRSGRRRGEHGGGSPIAAGGAAERRQTRSMERAGQ